MNPLPQNIQAPQLNYPLNMLQNQQSLRNSQQIPNQFQIRNSLAQPSMVHPVPQFNSKYSNVIQPNYFGYATGYWLTLFDVRYIDYFHYHKLSS